MRAICIIFLLACTITFVAAHVSGTIHGVKQRDQHRYQQTEFRCFDGSATVPAARINDDYCDCADGSDEPGTSACVNSKFFCSNRGAKGKTIPSSRVRDQVCDCCDGSDEYSLADQASPCPNTCEESGRAAREQALQEIASTEAGLIARATLIVQAQESIAAKKAKLAKYEGLMATRKIKLEEAKALKDAEEAIENAEREKRNAAAEQARLLAEAQAAAAAPAEGETATDASTGAATPSPVAEGTVEPAYVDPATPTPGTPEVIPAPEQKENFPYPPEYAYQQADDAAKKAEDEPATKNGAEEVHFPYPPEYAAPTGNAAAGGEDDGMMEPEYSDSEGEEQGDEGDLEGDDEGEEHEDGAEETQAEALYVHPGTETPKMKPMVTTRTPAAPTGSTFLDASTSIALFLSSLLTSMWSSAESLAVATMESTVWTQEWWVESYHATTTWLVATAESFAVNWLYLVTGNFHMDTVLKRWEKKIIRVLQAIGDGTVDLICWLELKTLGTNRFREFAKEQDRKAGRQGRGKGTQSQQQQSDKPKQPGDDYFSPGAESARTAHDALDKKVTRLQKKMDELKKLLERDYGPDAQFAHWDTKCFDLNVKQYTYEVCPYVNAKQKEGHSSTSLGTWSGLEKDEKTGQQVMKFSGGQTCWQGPQRSLTVLLQCGSDDKLLSVEEPSKCVYEIRMQTPAVCNAQHAQALQLNIEGGGIIDEEE